jgi:sulfofructose kinase
MAGHSRVVCIGGATLDVIAVVRDPVQPDGRVIAEDIVEAGGGNTANAAVALARLGVPVSFIGRIGDDAVGAIIRAGLEREGVDVSGLQRVPARRSQSSVILVSLSTAQRSIVTLPGASAFLELNEKELAACAAAEWIHVDPIGYTVVPQIRAAGISTRVSVDAGNPVPELDLRHVDLYAPTESALRRVMGTENAEQAAERALAAGAKMVVFTRGADGSAAALRVDGTVRIVCAPACRVSEIRSTLGAGDVFHGALLAALVRRMEVGEALRYANACAALSCRGLDGRSAIPTEAELAEFLQH